MERPIRRSVSYEDIATNPTRLENVYRPPERDNAPDDRSIIERDSDGRSHNYELESAIENPSTKNEKEKLIVRPSRIHVTINKFDGAADESIDDWFFDYEHMMRAYQMSETEKLNYISFH